MVVHLPFKRPSHFTELLLASLHSLCVHASVDHWEKLRGRNSKIFRTQSSGAGPVSAERECVLLRVCVCARMCVHARVCVRVCNIVCYMCVPMWCSCCNVCVRVCVCLWLRQCVCVCGVAEMCVLGNVCAFVLRHCDCVLRQPKERPTDLPCISPSPALRSVCMNLKACKH